MTIEESRSQLSRWLVESAQLVDDLGLDRQAEQARALSKKLDGELHIAFVGATSSGKSTIINNLLENPILPPGTTPTTASPVIVRVIASNSEAAFWHVNEKGETVPLGIEKFQFLAAQDSRGGYLLAEVPHQRVVPEGSILIDVPGYNSLTPSHEAVLAQWLPEMDRIYWVINAKSGLAACDQRFWDWAHESFLGFPDDTLSLILNCPDRRFEARIKSLRKQAAVICDLNPSLFTTTLARREGKNAILDLNEFAGEISRICTEASRQRHLYEHVADVAQAWLLRCQQDAESIKQQLQNADSVTEQRAKAFAENLDRQRKENHGLIEEQCGRWEKVAETEIENLDKQIWKTIEPVIDAAGPSQVESTANHICKFLIPDIMHSTSKSFQKQLAVDVRALVDKLETVWMDTLSSSWAPDMLDPGSLSSEGSDNLYVRKQTQRLAGGSAMRYLSQLGGRAGAGGVVGVMNLSRKVMGKVNALGFKLGRADSVFGREAMRRVGPLLKRFGLTTARTSAATAFIAVEFITFVYTSSTWKWKLRKRLRKELANKAPRKSKENRPVFQLANSMMMVSEQVGGSLAEETELIFNRRREVLTLITEELQRDGEARAIKIEAIDCFLKCSPPPIKNQREDSYDGQV